MSMNKTLKEYECDGQLSIFDYIKRPEQITPAQEYFNETGKTTYWQDSQGQKAYWWRDKPFMNEPVYELEIKGICDDPYCPQCGYAFWTDSSRNEVDCERCPECHVKVDWTFWHRLNDDEPMA